MIWPPILQDFQAEFTIFSVGLWMQDREIFGPLNSDVGGPNDHIGMDTIPRGIFDITFYFRRSLNKKYVDA
jgi:hypothetical protein